MIKEQNNIIIDPSCGSGVLLRSAFNRITQFSNKKSNKSYLIGMELHYDTWKVACKLKEIDDKFIDIEILQGDTIFQFEKLTTKIQSVLKNIQFENQNPEFIIIANPPFSKSQNLSNEYKKNASKILKIKNVKAMGLHLYFLELIYQILPNKGKFGLILPISISYSNKGKEIVQNFFSKNRIKRVIISEVETAFSVDSNFQEIIVIGEKNEEESNDFNKVEIISLKCELQEEEIDKIIKNLNKNSKDENNKYFSSYTILQEKLIHKLGFDGWNFLYRSKKMNEIIQETSKSLIPLHLETRILKKRGVNVPTDFFFIPNKYYSIDSETNDKVQLQLKNKKQVQIPENFTSILIPKRILIPLIRKPEYYKEYIFINESDNKSNFCIVFDENIQNDPEIKNYLEFGKSIGVQNRSNTSILQENWHLASKSYTPSGNLFLTFKWDPRYRSFLVNCSNLDMVIASQAFWVLKLQDENPNLKLFFLAWINSSLSMAIMLGLADVQRRVWRQLSGSRINSIPIIPLDFVTKLTTNDITVIKNFTEKKFDSNLLKELGISLLAVNSDIHTNEIRVQTDLLFLKLLITLETDLYIDYLKEFYSELIKELQKIFAL